MQWLAWDVIRPFVWFLFYPAVFLSPWLGGAGAGLAATVLATGLVWWFFLPPVHVLAKPGLALYLNAAMFMIMGGLFSYVHERLRRSDRRVAEALAQENQATFSQAAIGIAHLGLDGTWLRANARFCEIVGYDPEELQRTPYRNLVGPEAYDQDRSVARRLLEGGPPQHLDEKRFFRKDGSTGWLHTSISLVRDARGRPAFFLVVADDIGERKAAERRVQERDELLDRTSRLAKVGGWQVDVATGQGAWSEEVARIHGLDPATVPNVAMGLSFYHEEDRPRIARAVQAAIEQARPYDLEARLVTTRGEVKWVHTFGRPVIEGDRVARLYGALQDVTERKEMELALRESEARFRSIFEAAGVGMVEVDRATGRFWRVNQRFCDILGYSRQELLGLGFQDVTHPDEIDRDEAHAASLARGEVEGYTLEKRYIHKGGGIVWGRLHVRPLPDLGAGPPTNVSIVEDITARRQAEAELLALQATLEGRVQARTAELEAANAELESFTFAVSHDLRAPLRSIAGFSHALKEDCGPDLAPEGRDDLDRIIAASQRMGRIIDGLLELSRAGRCELAAAPVDLSALAGSLAADLAQRNPEREVQVRIEPGIRVHGDPRLMEAVLANLLENAWKYTARTAAAQVVVDTVREGDRRWVRVADNGAGFDMAHAGRLFQPFQRLHGPSEFPGVGIGLATVHRIVRRHGGEVKAQAAPGTGATFFLYLPEPAEA